MTRYKQGTRVKNPSRSDDTGTVTWERKGCMTKVKWDSDGVETWEDNKSLMLFLGSPENVQNAQPGRRLDAAGVYEMMPEKIWAEPITGQQPSHKASQWGLYHPADPKPLDCTLYIRADVHAAEVARLNENVNKLNKALEQALRYEEWVYSDEKRCPELAAWLKENK